jgi:hypothetical protein
MRVMSLVLSVGFLIATGFGAAAVQNNDAEISKCEGLYNTCLQSCSAEATASGKCKSDCDAKYNITCSPAPSGGESICKCTGTGPMAIKQRGTTQQLQPKTSKPKTPTTTPTPTTKNP